MEKGARQGRGRGRTQEEDDKGSKGKPAREDSAAPLSSARVEFELKKFSRQKSHMPSTCKTAPFLCTF